MASLPGLTHDEVRDGRQRSLDSGKISESDYHKVFPNALPIRKCPFCAKQIKYEAIVSKHCHKHYRNKKSDEPCPQKTNTTEQEIFWGILGFVKSQGIDSRYCQTDVLRINPRYKKDYEKEVFLGYFVTRRFVITVGDFLEVSEPETFSPGQISIQSTVTVTFLLE
jgi:hypothetical protein